jgi:hypothetical protein
VGNKTTVGLSALQRTRMTEIYIISKTNGENSQCSLFPWKALRSPNTEQLIPAYEPAAKGTTFSPGIGRIAKYSSPCVFVAKAR